MCWKLPTLGQKSIFQEKSNGFFNSGEQYAVNCLVRVKCKLNFCLFCHYKIVDTYVDSSLQWDECFHLQYIVLVN